MGRKKGDFASGDGGAPSAFAALEGLRSSLPTVDSAEDAPGTEAGSGAPGPRFAAKVVIRRERSGRGGKTVTIVDGVLLDGEARELFVKTLRKALGTSGRVEGDRLVFGGDVARQLEQRLAQAGAPKIVRGN